MKLSRKKNGSKTPAKSGKPGKKSGRPAKGALATVGGLMILSAVLRIATGASEALALDGNTIPDAHAPKAVETTHLPSIGEDEIVPILKALDAREARVKEREIEIENRKQALSLAEKEIDRKLAALQQAEESLKSTLSLAQTAAESDVSRLTDVYANMKPKQAAALFEEMDPEFAAGFIGRMRPNTAAAVMAGLSPKVAYTISVILAGRNANAPTE